MCVIERLVDQGQTASMSSYFSEGLSPPSKAFKICVYLKKNWRRPSLKIYRPEFLNKFSVYRNDVGFGDELSSPTLILSMQLFLF